MPISPLVSITLAALATHVKPPFIKTKNEIFAWIFVTSVVLYSMPPHSILCWWHFTTRILCLWPFLLKNPPSIAEGGPLGVACAKVCEVVAAVLLWFVQTRYNQDEYKQFPIVFLPQKQDFSQLWLGIGVVVIVSMATNVVLHVWSHYKQHDHDGVRNLVHSTVGRSLTKRERLHLLLLAFANANCEEFVSRGVWKYEYSKYTSTQNANLLQAVVFGIWHYHGIPSGWTGVGLTFVYGRIMGLLQDFFGGLFLPILAHTIADYFIFSVVARKSQQYAKRQ